MSPSSELPCLMGEGPPDCSLALATPVGQGPTNLELPLQVWFWAEDSGIGWEKVGLKGGPGWAIGGGGEPAPCLTHRVPAEDLPPEIPPEPRRGARCTRAESGAMPCRRGFPSATGRCAVEARGADSRQPGGHLVGSGSMWKGSSSRGREGRWRKGQDREESGGGGRPGPVFSQARSERSRSTTTPLSAVPPSLPLEMPLLRAPRSSSGHREPFPPASLSASPCSRAPLWHILLTCVLCRWRRVARARGAPWTPCSRCLFYWGPEHQCRASQGREL